MACGVLTARKATALSATRCRHDDFSRRAAGGELRNPCKNRRIALKFSLQRIKQHALREKSFLIYSHDLFNLFEGYQTENPEVFGG
jgi:hypothetical protein